MKLDDKGARMLESKRFDPFVRWMKRIFSLQVFSGNRLGKRNFDDLNFKTPFFKEGFEVFGQRFCNGAFVWMNVPNQKNFFHEKKRAYKILNALGVEKIGQG